MVKDPVIHEPNIFCSLIEITLEMPMKNVVASYRLKDEQLFLNKVYASMKNLGQEGQVQITRSPDEPLAGYSRYHVQITGCDDKHLLIYLVSRAAEEVGYT